MTVFSQNEYYVQQERRKDLERQARAHRLQNEAQRWNETQRAQNQAEETAEAEPSSRSTFAARVLSLFL